jgi:hypothetical protein
MDDYEFYTDYNRLITAVMNNSSITTQSWHVLDSECVELRFTEKEEALVECEYISEIVAAFTTANARVRLYKMLDWMHPSQLAYCDTDSVYMMYDAARPEHKNPFGGDIPEDLEFGEGLGQWKDELKGKPALAEFVGGGAKTKATRDIKSKASLTLKGITLDIDNESKLTFDRLKEMALHGKILDTIPREQFKWDTKTKNIYTQTPKPRTIRSTIDEKRTLVPDSFDTLPFGWKG